MNRRMTILDAVAGFLAGRRRRRRHTGPERLSAILPDVLADLSRQADRADAQAGGGAAEPTEKKICGGGRKSVANGATESVECPQWRTHRTD